MAPLHSSLATKLDSVSGKKKKITEFAGNFSSHSIPSSYNKPKIVWLVLTYPHIVIIIEFKNKIYFVSKIKGKYLEDSESNLIIYS